MNNLVIHVATALVDTAFSTPPVKYDFRNPNYSNGPSLPRFLAPVVRAEPSQTSRREAEDNA